MLFETHIVFHKLKIYVFYKTVTNTETIWKFKHKCLTGESMYMSRPYE